MQSKDIVPSSQLNIISGTFVLASFIYYLEIIYDLGIALFELINFKSNNK